MADPLDKAHDPKKVDISNSTRGLWLVKVHGFLFKQYFITAWLINFFRFQNMSLIDGKVRAETVKSGH